MVIVKDREEGGVITVKPDIESTLPGTIWSEATTPEKIMLVLVTVLENALDGYRI